LATALSATQNEFIEGRHVLWKQQPQDMYRPEQLRLQLINNMFGGL
jgi:hypothetical protein